MNLRIILDMNLSPVWVEFFTGHQIDARHWSEIGDPRDTDDTILNRALDFDACIMTQDLDFGTILALRQIVRPSVIQIRTPLNLPDQIGDIIFNAIKSNEARLQTGALLTIEPPQFRIRDLPII